MAPQSLGNLESTLAIICANGEGVPITFSLGNDEEVFDATTKDLTYTIGQLLIYNGEVKH
jgi:hypothetical protein